MQQQISIITLGIADLARSRRFYGEGFGWTPVFANEEIAFYQMNGFMLGTWLASAFEADSRRPGLARPGAFSLAHNVGTQGKVQPVLDRLATHGGRILRPADAPPQGGFRGYVADPDEHIWEIAWNPVADQQGRVCDLRHVSGAENGYFNYIKPIDWDPPANSPSAEGIAKSHAP